MSARDTVGYQVRFTDQVGGRTLVNFDDRRDLRRRSGRPLLERYDTIIIDGTNEA